MKKLRIIIGFCVSIFFLVLVLRKVNLKEILEVIVSVNLIYLTIAVVLGVFSLVVRSKRWSVLLGRERKVKVSDCFQATSVGLMGNNILPFRIGDLLQAYFLGYKTGLNKTMVFSTVIMERLLDIIPPSLILISGSFFVLMPEKIGRNKIVCVIAVLFILLFLIFRSKKTIKLLIDKLLPNCKIKENIKDLTENFYNGLDSIKDKKTIVQLFLYTFFLWSVYGGSLYFTLLSFNIKLSYFEALLIQSVVVMSVVIPSSPGYVGTWEFFTILALSIFGIDKSTALGFALVLHLLCWLPVTLIGLIVLIKSGLSLSQIEKDGVRSCS